MLTKVTGLGLAELAESCRAFFPDFLPAFHWLQLIVAESASGPGSGSVEDPVALTDDPGSPRVLITLHSDITYGGARHVSLWTREDEEDVAGLVSAALTELKADFGLGGQRCAFHAFHEAMLETLRSQLEPLGEFQSLSPAPCKLFFMSRAKVDELMLMRLDPPPGLRFDTLRPLDVPILDATWPHRSDHSQVLLAKRIGVYPSLGLRDDATGGLVAFETMSHPFGLMSHLYTVPEHRGKRLASLVELRLAQDLVRAGHYPYKFVVEDNVNGLRLTYRDGWWEEAKKAVKWVLFAPNSSQ